MTGVPPDVSLTNMARNMLAAPDAVLSQLPFPTMRLIALDVTRSCEA